MSTLTGMRLYHLDLKIAMFQPAWIRQWFARLKHAGYDGVCIEIDNKLIFPSHPEFAAPDALGAGEWRELIQFGRCLGLFIYPLIQTLGHMEHVLAPDTPLRRLAESPGNRYALCPSKPETVAFITDLIRDAHAVFESPARIHLGGDETRYVGLCPRCHSRPISELLARFMLQVHAVARSLGMQTEFWADMVLAHPATLDTLPKDIRFVDWLYTRTDLRGPTLRHCWGFCPTADLPPDRLLAGLPAGLDAIRPFLVNADGTCNAFYGAHFLKSRGYPVAVASGVRSSGDSYFLPRTRLNIRNVGATQLAAEDLQADHLVTSWAVRLSHPETTWPGMIAPTPATDDTALAVLGQSVGGLDNDLLDDLDAAQAGIPGIDILKEQPMRFQRPFDGDWLTHVRALTDAPDAAERIGGIRARLAATERLLPLFRERLERGQGDRDVLRHWICGLQLGQLRARQFLAVAEPAPALAASLTALIEANRQVRSAFTALWSESLTPVSLIGELEFKFNRDIRLLQEIAGA